MKIKDLLCDYNRARKLRKLGITVKSVFAYEAGTEHIYEYGMIFTRVHAYSSTELGIILRERINDEHFRDSSFKCPYSIWEEEPSDPKEANARADLLIKLIKLGHMNVEDINKRQYKGG